MEIIMETKIFDIKDFLKTEEDVIGFIKTALEENDSDFLIIALQQAIQSEGYAKIAKKMGVSREGLYKSFSGKTRPYFDTVLKAINCLGYEITLKPKKSINKQQNPLFF